MFTEPVGKVEPASLDSSSSDRSHARRSRSSHIHPALTISRQIPHNLLAVFSAHH
jgi:hypothetical protein